MARAEGDVPNGICDMYDSENELAPEVGNPSPPMGGVAPNIQPTSPPVGGVPTCWSFWRL